MGVVMALALTAGGFYFKWSQGEIAKLNRTTAEQGVTIAAQQQSMTDLTDRINTVQQLQQNYNNNVNRIRGETDTMRGQVSGFSDPGKASSQPRETEAVINQFTNGMFREYETISKGDNLPKPATPAKKKK
jgi:hypothetical protein